ncbi:MAG: hypothetical protein ACLSHL_03775 [Alistipes communis]
MIFEALRRGPASRWASGESGQNSRSRRSPSVHCASAKSVVRSSSNAPVPSCAKRASLSVRSDVRGESSPSMKRWIVGNMAIGDLR